MEAQDLIDAFEILDSWDARYELIADLEKQLVPIAEADHTDENLVRGCNTRTWLTGHLVAGEPPVVEYRADAEGPLVRGLVAALLLPFQHRTPGEILDTDAHIYVARLGLDTHLSPNRRAGMEAFLGRVKDIARAHVSPPA